MAKRVISFSDYQEPTWEEYTGEDPPANKWFNAELKKVIFLKDDDQLQFIFEITEGDFAGWGKSIYAPFEGERKFAMHQTIKAIQGGKMADVALDWENEKAVAAWVAKAKPVKLKTREYNNNILIAKVAPLLELATSPAKSAGAPKAELSPDPEVVADDEPIEDYSEEELAEMEVADLEEILSEEFELPKDDEDFPAKGSGRGAAAKYKKALVEAILAEQENGDDEDEDGEDEEGSEEDEEFEDGFEADEEEEEPEPEPAPRTRRSRAAKPAPAKAATPAAKPATTRRRRG